MAETQPSKGPSLVRMRVSRRSILLTFAPIVLEITLWGRGGGLPQHQQKRGTILTSTTRAKQGDNIHFHNTSKKRGTLLTSKTQQKRGATTHSQNPAKKGDNTHLHNTSKKRGTLLTSKTPAKKGDNTQLHNTIKKGRHYSLPKH